MARSYQVFLVDPRNESKYSDLKVLKSHAGWYVGTLYHDKAEGQSPGSRDTDYFSCKEDAELALELLNRVKRELGHDATEGDVIPIWEHYIRVLGLDPRRVGYRMTP